MATKGGKKTLKVFLIYEKSANETNIEYDEMTFTQVNKMSIFVQTTSSKPTKSSN